MKQAGVTTVELLTDYEMTKALMEEANKQDWHPEWYVTGSGYLDLQFIASNFPPNQASHLFGLSQLVPYAAPATDAQSATSGALGNDQDWFWGPKTGATSIRHPTSLFWLMNGIHTAGPHLTPQTFQQGLFSIPASGGAASDNPLVGMRGFGRTTGLPYDGYFATTVDFAPVWVDPSSAGVTPSIGGDPKVPADWFIDSGRRYLAGKWPTKPFAWFDKSKAITSFTTRPASVPVPTRAPCTNCPSTGNTSITTGSTSPNGFVAKAQMTSSS
jgi:hypothetical protein